MGKDHKHNKGLSLKKMLGDNSTIQNKKFSLKTMAEGYSGKKNSFDMKELAEQKRKKIEKLVDIYKSIFNTCIDDIRKANLQDIDFIVFQIPDFFNDFRLNIEECSYFLTEKLKKKKFDVCQHDENSLFISWKNALKESSI